MSIKIAAVCDNSLLGMALKKAGEECGVEVNYESQYEDSIVDKLSSKTINSSDVILFVTDREIEQIEEIERFIDREYYEVLPQFVLSDPKNVISEITMDLN